MSDEIKFTEEEMKQITEYQQRYVDVQMKFGQAEILRSRLISQMETLDDHVDENRKVLSTIQSEESVFIEEINKKYGDGVLDPKTGVFTPNS